MALTHGMDAPRSSELTGGSAVEAALAALQQGKFVIVSDGTDRENEGDLIAAAELVTPELVAGMLRHTSGVLCVSMEGPRLDELALPMMVARNEDSQGTAFTVTVDARHGTTTGISAADRATTIRALADPRTAPAELSRPGHVFPLRGQPGGVLRRPGHTEAAADLARLAGLAPVGVLCEVVRPDGGMARRPDLVALGVATGAPVITIEDLIEYRWQHDSVAHRVTSCALPTEHGVFTAHCYRTVQGDEHLALVLGEPSETDDVVTRVHSECLTGEAFGSLRCDCGDQLNLALARIAHTGSGVLVYLRGHEGRGVGLVDKLRAYALQDHGCDTVDANVRLGLPVDRRDYGAAGAILRDLGVHSIRLLTNNPGKQASLQRLLPGPVRRMSLQSRVRAENANYLATKRTRLEHLLDMRGTDLATIRTEGITDDTSVCTGS